MVLNPNKVLSIAFRSLASNKPLHAQWMITRKCNYRCQGCNVWREQEIEELSTKEVKRGLDILKKLGVIELVISGGNPLLRDDIGEIIDYSSQHFITTVYDNGSMAAEKVDALRNADFVAISVDSLNPEVNDSIKGVKGSLKKALEAIEILQKEGIRVSVSPTISQRNLYEIEDITKYFLKKEVPVWYCLYSYDFSGDAGSLFNIGRKNDEFLITDRKAMVELCDSLMKLKRENNNILITDKLLEALKQFYLNGKRIWKCQALKSFLMVDHLGRVAGCHLYEPIASIFDLPEAWDSEKFDMMRKIHSECTRCTYLCYIFYSLYGNVLDNMQIIRERWKSAKLFLKKRND
ncbi:MAG: radical SAM protein [Candidatus Bathyarchaeia archaeon]